MHGKNGRCSPGFILQYYDRIKEVAVNLRSRTEQQVVELDDSIILTVTMNANIWDIKPRCFCISIANPCQKYTLTSKPETSMDRSLQAGVEYSVVNCKKGTRKVIIERSYN